MYQEQQTSREQTHWGYRASALAKKATFVRDPYVSYPRRLIFWFFCNVISPHKQGSFDFSRARLAFFRDVPD
jgi:hypothetical protein